MELNDLNKENGSAPEGMDIKILTEKFISRWRWFAISIPLCLVIAFLVCQSRVPVYNVTGKVMISDSKKGELGTNLMMKELGLGAADMFVENEIVELQSKNLMREVVEELDLNIRYVREGFLRDRELYDSSPVKVLVDNPDGIRDTSFHVMLDTTNLVILLDLDGKKIWSGHYSESVPMGDYHISIEQNGKVFSREKIRVDLSTYRETTDRFSKNLNVQILVKNTNSVLVSLKDAVPDRGIAVINALVKRYNQNGIDNKRIVSEATVEFINERLDVINKELGSIERSAEDFKKTNRLTDITSDAAFVMERKKQAEAELLKLQTELDVLRSIRAAITQKRADEFALLPENLGLSDEGLNSGIARYNEMVLRRGKLLQSASESNPIVTGLNTQLRELKKNIQETIANVESSLLIKLKSVEKENVSVNEMLTSVPTQEKQYRAIARQQELKENLFLFLMQKREEAEIAKLIYVATAKIIEDPSAGNSPVEPKKALIMLVGLMFGIGLPAGGIFLLETLNDKVRSVEEVKRALPFPVLGDIPELTKEETTLLRENFSVSESMQVVREKLNYMLGEKAGSVLLVTSGVPGEGKTLVAAHLAQAYAKAGKKTLLVGCDLRNPQLHSYLHKNYSRGISAYLAGMEPEWKTLVHSLGDHLDVLFGGDVPPNPIALLSGERFVKLLAELRKQYDCVVLDTPPVGLLADALTMIKQADACICVTRLNVLPRGMLSSLRALESEHHVKNCGIVVNGVSRRIHYYKYGYGYGGYYNKQNRG
ncbi:MULTISPECIES: polysaccharide biosynthesis tyrosine autokinase [unclassified Butyricimonas]|uniref:GumC family protein n=1 Tax=unclassified Butyricimonas TaxID=2637652 RepID=UPI002100320C|nr:MULTISPECIES: polysaccharide biosynthesis tyrosine autokinase [unclassified Butyricimonas]